MGSFFNTMFCTDRDECEVGKHTCHRNAACVNIPGSYICECNKRGYVGDGINDCDGTAIISRPFSLTFFAFLLKYPNNFLSWLIFCKCLCHKMNLSWVFLTAAGEQIKKKDCSGMQLI